MTESKKPREFWIKATRVRNGMKSYTATIAPIGVHGEIHVIEKASYDQLKADAEELVEALTFYGNETNWDRDLFLVDSDEMRFDIEGTNWSRFTPGKQARQCVLKWREKYGWK